MKSPAKPSNHLIGIALVASLVLAGLMICAMELLDSKTPPYNALGIKILVVSQFELAAAP